MAITPFIFIKGYNESFFIRFETLLVRMFIIVLCVLGGPSYACTCNVVAQLRHYEESVRLSPAALE